MAVNAALHIDSQAKLTPQCLPYHSVYKPSCCTLGFAARSLLPLFVRRNGACRSTSAAGQQRTWHTA